MTRTAPSGTAGPIWSGITAPSIAGAVAAAGTATGTPTIDSFGLARIEPPPLPMQNDAIFWIASMTKPITATLVMMLLDDGQLRLDDPVHDYLPDFRRQRVVSPAASDLAPTRAITIRDLLSHTSGIPFNLPGRATIDDLPLRESVPRYAALPLSFDPGTHFLYSNAGIDTAARVAEVVSGQPYERLLADRILDPLGMRDTTFVPSPAQLPRLATGYRTAPETGAGLKPAPIDQLTYPLDNAARRHPSPAGGLFSTAADVARFCQLILAGGAVDDRRLLSQRSVRAMTTTQTASLHHLDGHGPDSGYGLGWETARRDDPALPGPLVGQTGHGAAFGSGLWLDPAHGTFSVVLVQQADLESAARTRFHRAVHAAAARLSGGDQ